MGSVGFAFGKFENLYFEKKGFGLSEGELSEFDSIYKTIVGVGIFESRFQRDFEKRHSKCTGFHGKEMVFGAVERLKFWIKLLFFIK